MHCSTATAAAIVCFAAVTATAAQSFPKLSPFDGIRFDAAIPDVKIGDTWYRPVRIGTVPADRLMKFCAERFAEKARKRFREDLVEVLALMDAKPKGNTITLELTEIATGKTVTLTDVEMTHDRRQRLRELAREGAELPEFGRRSKDAGRVDRRIALSPFDGLRWNGEQPSVRIGSDWFELVSYDGVDAARIVAFCKREYGRRWQKRFREDLMMALGAMGHEAGRVARLGLRGGETPTVSVREVRATRERRDALRDAAAAAEAEFRRATEKLDATAIRQDLEYLLRTIRQRYSYRSLPDAGGNTVDLDQVAKRLLKQAGATASLSEFAVQVMKLLAQFGDGHTRVAGSAMWLRPGFLPFYPAALGEHIVALRPDGRGLLDPEHPYLASMDGLPLTAWQEKARELVARGTPGFVARSSASRLRWIQHLRGELGLATGKTIRFMLANEQGETVSQSGPVSPVPARGPSRPTGYKTLDDNIGYLRIDSMDRGRTFEATLRQAMSSAASTDGLIIDVRDNGGGSRDALRVLLPYFLDQPARVVNVGAARLQAGQSKGAADGYLDNRYLWPANWSGWSKAARAAIAKCKTAFRPDWKVPAGEFSDWHYMVIERKPDTPHYRKPVIVLIDPGCFSATDIFVGGFAELPSATLLGQTTGGGSGRSRSVRLPRSGITIRLSSMASFRPDGSRYDGKGIAPDVVHEPTPNDLAGTTDSALDAAVTRLRN